MQKSRRSLSVLVRFITRYNTLRYHMKELRRTEEELCRGCEDKDVSEDTTHFVCPCPALIPLRKQFLAQHFFQDFEDIFSRSINDILK